MISTSAIKTNKSCRSFKDDRSCLWKKIQHQMQCRHLNKTDVGKPKNPRPPRSINPKMIYHFASQSQTCQLLKIKMLKCPSLTPPHSNICVAVQCFFFASWKGFLFERSFYTPRSNEFERFHLVRLSISLSVCGQNRVRSVSSTIIAGSISYLHVLSTNLRRCVVCQDFWKK